MKAKYFKSEYHHYKVTDNTTEIIGIPSLKLYQIKKRPGLLSSEQSFDTKPSTRTEFEKFYKKVLKKLKA